MRKLQRQTDKFVKSAREASSRGMSFLIVMLGVILQASHTTLLMYNIAAFESEIIKILVSLGIGLFISCSLAIFTLKYDGKNKEVFKIILVFFYFEIFTNIFYFWNSLIFSKGFDNATIQDWLYLIIAMPFAYIMPYAIKQFAGIISADEKLAFGDIDAEELSDLSEEEKKQLHDSIDEIKQQWSSVNEKVETLKTDSTKYLKKGENVQIKVGDKTAIVSLGHTQDDITHDDIMLSSIDKNE